MVVGYRWRRRQTPTPGHSCTGHGDPLCPPCRPFSSKDLTSVGPVRLVGPMNLSTRPAHRDEQAVTATFLVETERSGSTYYQAADKAGSTVGVRS